MKDLEQFKNLLVERGGELLGPTNPYEVLRFNTRCGVGVIYQGKRGQKWNAEALLAKEFLRHQSGSIAPVKIKGRRSNRATVAALIKRDGSQCFFCGLDLADDITTEHLVAIAHGGPNHISNLFLAHSRCNREAGHKSAPEKVAMAIKQRKGSVGGI